MTKYFSANAVLLSLFLLGSASMSDAQPTQTQVDEATRAAALAAQQAKEAEDRLKKAKADAELADLADAQRRTREKEERAAATESANLALKKLEEQRAALPKSSVTPLEGKTELTGEHSEGRILAQRAIARISSELANITYEKTPQTVLIVDATLAPMLWQHRAISSQLKRVLAEYQRLLAKGPQPQIVGVETATAYVAAAAGLLALFRTDTKIDTKTLTIAETALIADLVYALKKKGISVYYPPLILPDRKFVEGKEGIYKDVLEGIRQREIAEAEIANKHPRSDSLKAVNAQFGKLLDQLYASDEKGQSLLLNVLKAEQSAALLEQKGTMTLAVKAEFAASSSRVQRNLFIFTGSRLSYSAGVVVSYFLMSNDGKIESARTLYDHSGFVNVKDIDADSLLTNIQIAQ